MMNFLKIRSILLVACLACTTLTSKAQFLSDNITGLPIVSKGYTDVKGIPFLSDNWLQGTVKLKKGISYKDNLYLKYNLLDDELYFKNKNEDPLTFVDDVSEFTILYKGETQRYKNGYSIEGYTNRAFFEVLAEGSSQLLKKNKKVILENKAYNSSTVEKSFEDVIKYYVIVANKATLIKKDKKSIYTALGNHQPELEAYIKKENLNLKNDPDLTKLFIYYNSL